MKPIQILVTALIMGMTSNVTAQDVNIIPEPYKIEKGNGVFTLKGNWVLNAPENASAFIDPIASQLSKVTGKPVSMSKQNANLIFTISKNKDLGAEGYQLMVNKKGVQITANTEAGLFYGWQTLQQMMPVAIYGNQESLTTQWNIPFVNIIDKPRFAWRGLMLDVSRHFFTKEEVKKYIDNMVQYKYNVLHLHLTDDQGWRIEIKSLPKLTEIGAWRAERKGKWMNTNGALFDEPKTYGGYYTHEDIQELVAYAKSKFVNIVPEIDIPGHSMAFLAAYPLSTTPDYKYQVNVGEEFMDWEGLNGHVAAKIDNSLNPANEKVYEYLDKIFSEVASLFPFEYIHIGGDENAKNNWEKSEAVQALMKKEGLKNQMEVQSYFVKRVEKIIKSKGKKLMGWDEILEGGLPADAAVMSWRGVKGGIEAAKQQHKVVMSPNAYNYIDFYQGELTAEGKVYAGLRMKKTYSFEPIPDSVDANLIIGNQANLWTEQIQNLRNAQYMTWPRALAVAETSWSPKEKKNWSSFTKKVESHFEKLDASNIKYAKSIYDPIVTTQINTKGELIVNMEGEMDGLRIYFTIDDAMPDHYSTEFIKPFVVPEDVANIRVISYRDGKPMGKILNIPIESLKKRAVKVL